MSWQNAIGFISTVALFIPVVLIISFKLYRYYNYLALMCASLITVTYNLMSLGMIVASPSFIRNTGIVNNLVDAPLMIFFLMLFSGSLSQLNRMRIYVLLFLCFETVILFIYGFTLKSLTIIMGPGLLLVFAIAFYHFIRKAKLSIVNSKALGKALLAGAVTFAYGCYGFLYLMHYVISIDDVVTILLIYWVVSIIFSSLMVSGLIIENSRVKKREELLHTRKELEQFFADEKKPALR